MLNHITIMGRLTRDPELRHTGSGVPCAKLTVTSLREKKRKLILLIALHGAIPLILSASISPKAA